MKEIDWPTERHRIIGEHIVKTAEEYGMGVLLKGSLATGTAGRYSDIDMALYGRVTRPAVKELLYSVERPLLITESENPPGLLIVVYCKGLGLDLGIYEIKDWGDPQDGNSVVLHNPVGKNRPEQARIDLSGMVWNGRDAKVCKLFHKGLLKYMNGKTDEAKGFIEEILEFTGLNIEPETHGLLAFEQIMGKLSENLPERLRDDFEWLFRLVTQEENEVEEKEGARRR